MNTNLTLFVCPKPLNEGLLSKLGMMPPPALAGAQPGEAHRSRSEAGRELGKLSFSACFRCLHPDVGQLTKDVLRAWQLRQCTDVEFLNPLIYA